MQSNYNGGLTREQFLYYEIRIVASLVLEGMSREDILKKIQEENLFQFPTERMVSNIVGTCFKRIEALPSQALVAYLAEAPAEVAKQINLYAMMRYNGIVWDFMTTVIGEKFRTQELELAKRDLNIFMFRLQEQNDILRRPSIYAHRRRASERSDLCDPRRMAASSELLAETDKIRSERIHT